MALRAWLAVALLLSASPALAQLDTSPNAGSGTSPNSIGSNPWLGPHNAVLERPLADGLNIIPPYSFGVWTLTVGGATHVIRCPASIAVADTMIFEITEGANVISFDPSCYGWAGKSPSVFTASGYDEVICHSRTPTAGNLARFTCNQLLNVGLPPVPPAFVQAKFGTKVTSGTTFNVAMTSPLTAGNSVACLALYNGSGSISSVSDGTNSYTAVDGPTAIGSAFVQTFKLISLTGSPSTITGTVSAAVTGGGIECVEVTGASLVDVHALNVQGINGFATDSVTSGNVTTTNASELLVGLSLVTSGVQINAGTGQTLATHDTTGTGLGFIAEYKLTGAPGAYASTFTSTDNSNDNYGSAVLAFH
jgi:hypothetical protein